MTFELLKSSLPDVVYQQLHFITAIDGPKRCAHFLGQCHHESGGFKRFTENLSYSANRLLQVFPKRFTSTQAAEYANQPERIGNHIYADRLGNGPESSGDGYRFRGRGAIQLTGRSNYAAFGGSIGVDLISSPDLVATQYSLVSAGWFFTTHNLWTVCDNGIDDNTIAKVTRAINGGVNGLDSRIELTHHYWDLLHGSL